MKTRVGWVLLGVTVGTLGAGCGDEAQPDPMETVEMGLDISCAGLTGNYGTVEVIVGQASYPDLLETIQFAVPIEGGELDLDCTAGNDLTLEVGPVLLPAGRFAAVLQALGTGPCDPSGGQYQVLEVAALACDTTASATAPCTTAVRPMSCPGM